MTLTSEVLAYEGPDGELILSPSLEEISACLDLGTDYWEGGTRSASLGRIELLHPGYRTLPQHPVLHLVCHPPYGFCLTYTKILYRPFTSDIHLITYQESATALPPVLHHWGETRLSLPQECFVARHQADTILAAFLQTEQPSPTVNWKPRAELGL